VTADIQGAIARVWKDEAAKIIGGLVRIVRDVSLAEELAQDALVAALEQWPVAGMPTNPAAWLTTTARNRALNTLRRARVAQRTSEATAREAAPEGHDNPDKSHAIEAAMDDDVGDDVLRLIFIACHPVLSKEARVALTLRMVGGLTTEEIARAFLSTESRSRSGSCARSERSGRRGLRSSCRAATS
jgi:RNA polymerase sigma factor (sigma-70 family)